jgi:hypothetical protein
MSAGRPTLPPRRAVILRIDEVLLAETYTLNPELQDPSGGTRYGALNKFLTGLIVKHNEGIKKRIRGATPRG